MTKLPVTSGRNIIKALSRFGWIPVRQKGSHVILIKDTYQGRKSVPVPVHKEIDKKLLSKIIKETEVPKDKFLKLL